MNQKQKGFAPILIIGLVVLILSGVGGTSYYLINKQVPKQTSSEKTYKNVVFENNANTEKGEWALFKYWDKKIIGTTQDNKNNTLIESVVATFSLDLRGDPIMFTFVPKNQTAYFYTTVDGTEISSNCYSFDVFTLKIKQLNYKCFDEFYTAYHIISSDGSKVAYLSHDSVYIIDITNGSKKELAKAKLGEIFYAAGPVPDFTWMGNDTIQYPIYYQKDIEQGIYKVIETKKVKI